MSACIKEHRWGDRVPVNILVQLIGPTGTVTTGRLSDFSASGAFIETPIALPAMASITVMIPGARGGSRRAQAIRGYVARQGERGIGMGWWNLAPVTVAHVLAISEPSWLREDLMSLSQIYN